MQTLELASVVDNLRLCHGIYEDFPYLVSGDRWTALTGDGGSVAVGAGGIVVLTPSDGTVADNDEAYLHTTTELFKAAADKPIVVEAYLQFSQANVDDANILFGLMDAPAADHLLDNGGGPAASYSGAVFFSVDGDTTWRVENSVGATQKTTELDAAGSLDRVAKTSGSSGYQRLAIELRPHSSTLMDVLFKIDGILVAKHKDQVYTNFTDASVVFGVKNGGANLETLNVDYVSAYQKR